VRRRWLLLPLAAVATVLAVPAVELALVLRRDYATDPGFDIDETVPGRGEPLELVVLGDSTVAGFGVDRVEDTMAVQAAREFADRTGRAVRVRTFGVGGARTRDVLRKQVRRLPDDLDAIIVEVGSNDSTHFTRLDQLDADTRELVGELRSRTDLWVLGGSGPLDSTTFARPLRDIMRWRARDVRELQERIATEESHDPVEHFVDMGGEVNEEYSRTPGATSFDDFHPAAPGYGVWGRALGRRLAEVVEATGTDEVSDTEAAS
jgi:lysophospholipase L1-like esterase